ncbi:MAG: ABC transporter ATP-binding protein [Rhodospirillales bacterium]|jgi:ABC-2 type transport system ATP-binding protein|nr:ABC transporter ATP-binding protein [Rhodospirillales bacterium]
MTSEPQAVRVENLAKNFGAVQAIDQISFAVPKGGCMALLGGNGAGKTTTLSILLGLLIPDGGKVLVLGQDMVHHRFRVLDRLNFSSPYVDLPHRLTVRENLTVYALLFGLHRPRQRVEQLAEDFGVAEHLDKPTGRLSSGQRTRVALAKALLNDPELLLLDEPTASLDPDTADWVRTRLEDWRKKSGAALLIASHNMAEVERLADTAIILKQGRIVEQGTPKALIDRFGRANLEEVFLHVMRSPEVRT